MVLRFHSWDYQLQISLQVAKTCMDRYEYVAVESMEKATQVIIEIARLAAYTFNKKRKGVSS